MPVSRKYPNISYAFKDLRALEKTFAAVAARENPAPVWLAGARRRANTAVRRLGDVAVPYLMRQLGTAREPRASFARYLLARLRSPRVVAAATQLLEDRRADDSAKVLGLALLADLGVPAPAHVALSHPDRVLASAVDQILQTLRGRADYTEAAHLILSQVPDDELIEFGRATLRHAGERALPLLRALVDCGEMGDEARDALRALAGGAVAPATTRPHEDELERGIALFEQRRFAAAEKHLTRFVHANPQDLEGRSTLGVCLTRRGLPERALPHLIFCAAAEPGEALHHWNLAAAAQHAGRLARCYLALRAYLQSAGLEEADRREGAEGYVRQYERAVREEYRDLDPVRLAQGEEIFVQAQLDLRAGRAADAVRELERVLTLVPSHYPTWGSLGAAYLELGRRDQATHCLERALELRPDYDVARRTLQTLRA